MGDDKLHVHDVYIWIIDELWSIEEL